MLSSTLWKAFTTPITYALIAVLVGTAVMQVKYVNKSLARFDSTQVIPVQFVMFTLSVIIGSAVLYRDFESTTPERAVKFIGGCLLTFFGVFLITSGRSKHDDDESDIESDVEGEERITLIDHEAIAEGRYQDEADKYATVRRQRQVASKPGDGADDEDNVSPDQSRRSSRVSFAPSQGKAQSSQPPSIRLTSSADVSQTSLAEPPFLSNPWKNLNEDILIAARNPSMPSTNSTPILPQEAQTSNEFLQTPISRSVSHSNPQTHPNHQHGGPPLADTQRPATPVRHSISRMIPGPYLSPLSSSLSAVVADTLRRGVDSTSHSHRKGSFRRPRLSLRRSKSGSQRIASEDGLGAAGEEDPGSPLKNTTSIEDGRISKSLSAEAESPLSKRMRARTLSNALGDFFGVGRKRTEHDHDQNHDDNEEGNSDGGAGPSSEVQRFEV
jgi:hypothetical protein